MKKELKIVSVSGGKDSTALYLICMEFYGNDFLPIFADTGNEHPVTVNYVKNLHHMTGGPQVQIVKADFTKQIKRKWKNLHQKAREAKTWEEQRFWLKRTVRCKPTGKPFHDLLMWKGRAPSAKAQFCTEHLKLWPILFFLENNYTKSEYDWVMFTGIRAGESANRAKKQPFMWNSFYDCPAVLPLLYEEEKTVFQMHHDTNTPVNPLYKAGSNRVGCYPCVNSSKGELRNLEDWAWDKLGEFEGQTFGRTWFPPNMVPGVNISPIKQVKEWVQTSRGGRQYNMFLQHQMVEKEDTPSCMSGFMVCE